MVPAMLSAQRPLQPGRPRSRARAALTIAVATIVTALPIASSSSPAATRAGGRASVPSAAMVVVRTGDPAPAVPRLPHQFGGPLAATATGGALLRDLAGTSLFRTETGGTTLLAWSGEQIPEGTIESIQAAGASPDGSVVCLAWLTWAGEVLLRIPPGGGTPSVLLGAGRAMTLPGGGTVWLGPFFPNVLAIDGAGRVVLNAAIFPSGSALIRVPAAGPAELLLRDGDPLGGGTVDGLVGSPGVSPSGSIAFSARLVGGAEVVATLPPGSSPVVLETLPSHPPTVGSTFGGTAPAINDAGVVAYFWTGAAGGLNLQRISGGDSRTILATGSPAPGSGTFSGACCGAPIVEASGGILFGAYRSETPYTGIYRFTDATRPVVEEGDATDDGATIETIDLYAAPALGADGTLLFAAYGGTAGEGFYSARGATIHREGRAGDAVVGPARFVFVQPGFGAGIGPGYGGPGGGRVPPPPVLTALVPNLGGGPYLSPAGRMVFDARVTGGGRGLFLREPDGGLAALVLDGDAAPGGGHYDGSFFSYHSINDAGTVAFIAAAPDGPTGSSLFLAYGPATGPLVRLVGSGDPVPGSSSVVSGFQPPSRVGADGSVAIPLFLSDGTVTLTGWDGAQLVHVAAPGDVIPGEGAIESIVTGAVGRLIPPLLDDAGEVTFGAITATGGQALYRAPLREGGYATAVRVIGQGDAAEGGPLGPFVPQAFDLDETGRFAFQAPPGGSGASADSLTTLRSPGSPDVRIAAPGEELPGIGTVDAVVPHLALAANERLVHEIAGPSLLARWPMPIPALSGQGSPGARQAGEFRTVVLAGAGLPSPDGGIYAYQPYLLPDPPPFPPPPIAPGPRDAGDRSLRPAPVPASTTLATINRLASDGDHLLAWMAGTSMNPQEIILFDLNANQPPAARAGAAQVVECAGPSGTAVTLDGSDSFDPEGGPITFEWSGPFGTATGPRPTVTLPLGTTTIALTVADEQGATSTSTVDVVVRDTAAPTLSVQALPSLLWPHNGRMVTIGVAVESRDLCDPAPAVTLTGIDITDKKPGDPAQDIADAAYGTDDRTFQVRATRAAGGDGRIYTAHYVVTDATGNTASAAASILVPLSRKP